MENDSLTIIGDENELTTTDRIEIYKEIIRLLEKDIETIQSADYRDGWNTWGMLGAIVGAGLLLLGQTKDLTEIPPDIPKISAVLFIVSHTLIMLYNFSFNNTFTKEKRLIAAGEVFKLRNIIVGFLPLIVALVLIYFSDIRSSIKLYSSLLILTPIIVFLVSLSLSSYIKVPLGNNPNTKKSYNILGIAGLTFNITASVLLVTQLKFPLGPTLSSAYLFSFCIVMVVILFQILMSKSHHNSLSELNNLKDDLIFNRLSPAAIIQRYQILKEGKSLYDEMHPEYGELLGYLFRENEIYDEQEELLSQFDMNIIDSNDSDFIKKDKGEKLDLINKVISSSSNELSALIGVVVGKMPNFYTKLSRAAGASGDQETELQIRNSIQQILDSLNEKEKKLNEKKDRLREKIKKLDDNQKELNKPEQNT